MSGSGGIALAAWCDGDGAELFCDMEEHMLWKSLQKLRGMGKGSNFDWQAEASEQGV